MMIQMVMDINKNNFAGVQTVTCYTCHHGVADPITTPILPTGEAMMADGVTEEPDTSQAPDRRPDCRPDTCKPLAARPALRKVTSRSITATWDTPFWRGRHHARPGAGRTL